MMDLAKLLHARDFHITFVNTEFNHRRLLRSTGIDTLNAIGSFRFETIPDGLPPSDEDTTHDVIALCESTSKNGLVPLIDLVKNKLNSSPTIPRVTCLISDGVTSFGIDAGKELGIPVVQFWTASACGFMGFLQYGELIQRGYVPLKDESMLTNGFLDTEIDWIPGMKNIRLKDLPSFIRTTDPNAFLLKYMERETRNCLNASAIIFNTFDELEHEVLNAISSQYPRSYTLGSVSMLAQRLPAERQLKSIGSSLWKEDSQCLHWLDRQKPNSTVYVNVGSVAVMTDQQLNEIARGLANSNHNFLWVLRSDGVAGESSTTSLPEDFMDKTRDRCLLLSWCPQEWVLSHPSVGGFLMHCGWNSMLESICGGKPVICCPFGAEQHTNCRYACTTWEIGLDIDNDIKREGVENAVEELMEGEKGKRMSEKALGWKEKAKEATAKGGSSYLNFDRLIDEVLEYPNV